MPVLLLGSQKPLLAVTGHGRATPISKHTGALVEKKGQGSLDPVSTPAICFAARIGKTGTLGFRVFPFFLNWGDSGENRPLHCGGSHVFVIAFSLSY